MKETYVGKDIKRIDGMDKATGRALYAGDYYQPDMLEIALVRSSIPHGMIKHIDFSKMPKECIYFTADDLKCNIIEGIIEDQPALASDKVRFMGEPIAIIAAPSRAIANAGASLVEVTYDKLPVINDVYEAIGEGAEPIHKNGNELQHFSFEKGSVEEGFNKSDFIIEEDFYTPVQDHGYMEPEAAFTYIDEANKLMVYSSTQNVFADQKMIARVLGLNLSDVNVKAATVGGGFGGKDGNTTQIFAAVVTWLTKKTSKLVFDREESLMTTYKRHAANMHVKMGFSKDGKILAFDGTGYLDTGAYAGLGTAVLGLFTEHFAGPYDIENVRLDSHLIYTNKPIAHAMRGFGAPQGAFATETLINRTAKKLAIDPIHIRIKNAVVQGSIGALGQTMEHSVGYKEALKLIENSPLWQERKENQDPNIGYGIAGGHLSCGLGKNIPDEAKVIVEEKETGNYLIKIGLVDIGQGSRTSFAALAAEALEVNLDQVEVIMADTKKTLDCGSTAGSRSTYVAGNALLTAINEHKKNKKSGVMSVGTASFPECNKEFDTPGFPHAMHTFIAQAVKVKVNPVTGQVELLDIFAATEAGKILNPLSMAGQIQGGIGMSIGYAFGENCIFREGLLLNKDFSTYLMPTALDIPSISNVNVQTFENSGPMGVKGAAEVSTVAIAPAIGSAIEEIVKVQLNELPFNINNLLSEK